MNDFLSLFETCLKTRPHLCLECGYSSVTDWSVYVYDKTEKSGDWGDPVVSAQTCDKRITFAEATVRLSDYMAETCGGY